ncbi:MAG: Flp pilus assembly complex ATPase component TadA [Candidatus Eremiobacteraeota bacterium]|nr:Flp pilus assembly complex ATPase component TadA [Candidatus Eremiobacteraeota bacterium]
MSAAIVALINAKGGSGATTIALEVARGIRRAGGHAAVVDGDLSGRRNVAVLLDAARAFDSERAMSVCSVIERDGITAVELTDSLDNSFMLRVDQVEALVERLSPGHDVMIVDAPTPFSAPVRPFMARAARFAIVLEPNLLGTAAARTLVGDLAKFGVPLSRIWLITNLRAGRAEISSRELEKALGGSVIGEIPVRGDRNYARAIDALAKRIASVPHEPPLPTLRPASGSSNGGGVGAPVVPSGFVAPEIKPARGPKSNDRRDRLKAEVHEQVTKRIDVVAASRAHTDNQKIAELRAQIGDTIAAVLAERAESVSLEERAELQQEIIDELLGLGPLEDLMRDPSVSEIMVNGADTIYVERSGKLTMSDRRFADERHLRTIIERIIAPLGRRIDESSPMVDARLPDGSRVNAIIEPLSLGGSTLTIRRFGTRRLTMDDLLRFGSISQECIGLLRAMVEARLNIVVSGGTGSGKTTFLNILSNYIPNTERIVTIEDAAELSLNQEHVVRLESRPPNLEGRGAVHIRDLVRNSLRMRPDRIVVGECRGGEALDMLQAMNTGHDGSLTTLHANTPRDALSRMETLVLMAGFELPVRAIREQIASAVDAVVQIARLRDGSRRVTSIAEIVGMEGDVVTMQELIRFSQRGLDKDGKVVGEFQYTGVQPHYLDRFEEAGVHFDIRDLAKLQSAGTLW